MNIALIASNKAEAPVLQSAADAGIDTFVINRDNFRHSDEFLSELKKRQIDLIVLAGFLWLVPENLVTAFNNRIVNIHPALLPKFGGKGMYGMNVHRAVKAAGEVGSGMAGHYENAKYDDGDILFQAKTDIEQDDTPEDIAAKVLALEHKHYAPVIEELISDL